MAVIQTMPRRIHAGLVRGHRFIPQKKAIKNHFWITVTSEKYAKYQGTISLDEVSSSRRAKTDSFAHNCSKNATVRDFWLYPGLGSR